MVKKSYKILHRCFDLTGTIYATVRIADLAVRNAVTCLKITNLWAS